MRVIAVVMGASTPKERNKQITQMFDFAFSQYETKPIYAKGDPIREVKIEKGEKRTVTGEAGESISLLIKKGEKLDNVSKKFVIDKNIQAPIEKGEEIGKIILSQDGKVVAENSIVASEAVDSASWWTLFKRAFSIFTKIQ